MEELSAAKEEQDGSVWTAADSSASENVVSEKMVLCFKVRPSEEKSWWTKVRDRKRYLDEQGREGREGEDQGGVQLRHENAGDLCSKARYERVSNLRRVSSVWSSHETEGALSTRGQSSRAVDNVYRSEGACSAITVSAGRGNEFRVCRGRGCFPCESA